MKATLILARNQQHYSELEPLQHSERLTEHRQLSTVDLSAAEFRRRKRIYAAEAWKNVARRCASRNLRAPPPPNFLWCAGGAADFMNYCCTCSTRPVNSITINDLVALACLLTWNVSNCSSLDISAISTKRRLVEEPRHNRQTSWTLKCHLTWPVNRLLPKLMMLCWSGKHTLQSTRPCSKWPCRWYISISASSVPVESMFSTTGLILNSKRSSLYHISWITLHLFIHDNCC